MIQDQIIMLEPIIKALIEEKIFYYEKHTGYAYPEQGLFIWLMAEYYEKAKPFWKRKKGYNQVGFG